jgi:hypothetical protein
LTLLQREEKAALDQQEKYSIFLQQLETISNGKVAIKDGTYVGKKKPAIFIQEGYGEFSKLPIRVLKGSFHPLYMKEQRRHLFKEKFKAGKYSHFPKAGSAEAIERMSRARKGLTLTPKELQEKSVEALYKKYGVKNPFSLKSVKDKIKQTNMERYGVENPMQNQSIKDKSISTHMQNNDGIGLGSEKIREKVMSTLSEKGVINVSQLATTQETIRNNNLKKYGVEWYSQTLDSKEHYREVFKRNNPDKLINNMTQTQFSMENDIPLSSLNRLIRDGLIADEIISKFTNYSKGSSLERIAGHVLDLDFFNKKTTTTGRRADFKLTDTTYLNIDGLFWHAFPQKSKTYHMDLRKEYEQDGMRLIQFYESELLFKAPIIKSMINSILGKNDKIFARKTILSYVEHKQAAEFLNNNHIMGVFNGRHVGLFVDGDLLCLVTYTIRDDILNIDRLCSKQGINVVGGFSKLLKFIEENNTFVKCNFWVDLRYGDGSWLKSLGFIHSRDTLSFKWVNPHTKEIFHRLKIRATTSNTQNQVAAQKGLFKLYDAGQRLFTKLV